MLLGEWLCNNEIIWEPTMELQFKEFSQKFEILPVTSLQQLHHCQRLRYHVFCKENNVFETQRYADQLERDKFDKRAVHSLIRYKPLDIYIATVRLVLHDPLMPAMPFPMEQLSELSQNNQNWWLRPRKFMGEVSRFAISKEFRQTSKQLRNATSGIDPTLLASYEELRQWYPYILLGLFRAVIQMSYQYDVQYWYAGMEPGLLRLLGRFGIHFTKLGPLVDYHGKRQPCICEVSKVVREGKKKSPDVWRFVSSVDPVWEERLKADDLEQLALRSAV